MEARRDAAATRTALPGFVSTTVLTSSDGLFGDNVEETRITEAAVTRPEDAPDYRPLYDRLQERQEKKDSDWLEKNNPFAPPKALDDEEIEFIRDLEKREAAAKQRRKEQHNEDLAGYLLAKQQATESATNSSSSSIPATAPNSAGRLPDARHKLAVPQHKQPAPVVVRAKRKASTKDKTSATTSKKAKNTKTSNEKATKPPAAVTPVTIGLVAYDSDSEDSN